MGLAFALLVVPVLAQSTAGESKAASPGVNSPPAEMSPAAVPVRSEESKPAAEGARTKEENSGLINADYQISPQDLLVINVVGEKELTDLRYRVPVRGEISFPYIGDVKVAGLTIAEVRKSIYERLDKDYIINPNVMLRVDEYSLRFITVIGEVNRPGAVEMKGENKWTIVDAIAQAGGPTKNAKMSGIEFTRKGKTQKFNLEDLKKTSDPSKIIWIEPGDVIRVLEKIF
jgi:protein involved in polysaccharide export with SLBB domain